MNQRSYISPASQIFLSQSIEGSSMQNLCKNMLDCNNCCQEQNERIYHPQYIIKARGKNKIHTYETCFRKESLRQKKQLKDKGFQFNLSVQENRIKKSHEIKGSSNQSQQIMIKPQFSTGFPKNSLMQFSNLDLKNKKISKNMSISQRYKLPQFIPQIYSETSSSNNENVRKPKSIIQKLSKQQLDQNPNKEQSLTIFKNRKSISLREEKKQLPAKNISCINILKNPFTHNYSYGFANSLQSGSKQNIKQSFTKINEVSRREQDDQSCLFEKGHQKYYSSQENTKNRLKQNQFQNHNFSKQLKIIGVQQKTIQSNITNADGLNRKHWQNLGDFRICNQTTSTAIGNLSSINVHKSVDLINAKGLLHENTRKPNAQILIKSLDNLGVSNSGQSNSRPNSFKNSFGSSLQDISCRSKIKSIGNTSESDIEIVKSGKPMSAHFFRNQVQNINELIPHYVQSIVTSKNHNNEDRQFSQVQINYFRKVNSPPTINVGNKDSMGSIQFGMQKIIKSQGQSKQYFFRNMQKGKGILFLNAQPQK